MSGSIIVVDSEVSLDAACLLRHDVFAPPTVKFVFPGTISARQLADELPIIVFLLGGISIVGRLEPEFS